MGLRSFSLMCKRGSKRRTWKNQIINDGDHKDKERLGAGDPSSSPSAQCLGNDDSCASLLREYGNACDLDAGRALHARLGPSGRLQRNPYLASLLVRLYGKCGMLQEARAVFDQFPRDLLSWNVMIAAYARNGRCKEALGLLFGRMLPEGLLRPDRFTFLAALSAAVGLADLAAVKRIHELVLHEATACQPHVTVLNALLSAYAKCDSLHDACVVFEQIGTHRDIVSWNAMIAAYTQTGHPAPALQLFSRLESIEPESETKPKPKPNKATFLCLLHACSSLPSLEHGKRIHECVIASGFHSDIAIQTALLDMYGKCRSLKDANHTFDNMKTKDVYCWTAMLNTLVENSRNSDALELFRRMCLEGVTPNRVTFLCLLNACSNLASSANGRAIHRYISVYGLESDASLQVALLHMYGKCSSPEDARIIFDRMHKPDIIAWSAMLSAYAHNGQCKEALDLFTQMELQGVKPNKLTFLSLLSVCTNGTSLDEGRAIHKSIVDCGIEADIEVSNALINMYGKCGSLKEAQPIFDQMHRRDVITWSAMLVAYAQNGHPMKALKLFEVMSTEIVKPDKITFISLLNACSHAGLWELGWEYFVYTMGEEYGVTQTQELYVCMLDLLGRAGCLSEAETTAENMPVQSDYIAWITLLGASQIHDDVERGINAAEHVIKLDPNNEESTYHLLLNLYASAGRWEDLKRLRDAMQQKGLKKRFEHSLIRG